MEWQVVEDYDYHAEIATSCYGDMLHDDERNKKFGAALKKAIEKMHKWGKEAHVLDIGTGTGLLAMLAVSYGADSVVACEMFRPVANCAARIIAKNSFSEKIKLVYKHSTSLTVGPGCDLPRRMNILVSEVFDTELIGEGAIKTFNHAHEFLLEDDCIVIPSIGTVYGQVVESSTVKRWNEIQDWKSKSESLVVVPAKVKKCPGAPALHDIQLSQLPLSLFKSLSDPLPMFKFDFMKNTSIPTTGKSSIITNALNSGIAQVVFMWWDLVMDDENEIVLSCAPVWHHPDGKNETREGNPAINIPWRDHWMQAIYFLQTDVAVEKDTEMTVHGWHDEFSLWFAVDNSMNVKAPVCNCGVHILSARTRIGAMNDPKRCTAYTSALQSLPKNINLISIGDFSLIGLAAAKINAKHVYITLQNLREATKMAYTEFIACNKLENIVSIHRELEDAAIALSSNGSVDDRICILGEPYFQTSLLAWDNAYFWVLKERFVEFVNDTISREKIIVFPQSLIIKGCCVQFDDLWKIRRPLKKCMGLDMSLFDDLINKSKEISQISPEPQPLWEYPCRARSEVKTLLTLDMSKPLPNKNIEASSSFSICGPRVDGVVIWAEIVLWNGSQIRTGALSDVNIGQYIQWDRCERQGVHLYKEPKLPNENISLHCLVCFDPQTAEVSFDFPE